MKSIKTTLIATALLISCNAFGMFNKNLTKNEELLFTAIENGDQQTFDKLLTPSKKLRFDKIFWMLPFLDVHIMHEPIFDDIDINVENIKEVRIEWWQRNTPLRFAIYSNNPVMTQSLIEKGATIDSALCSTARLNRPQMLQVLLNNGANINIHEKESGAGYTPLHIACMETQYTLNYEMVKILLCNNAELLNNFLNQTPLDLVTIWNDQILQGIIQEIIDYKAEVSINNTADALDKAITNNDAHNSEFTKKEWLILALHNKHHKQINYCIANTTFEPEYILALILLNKRLPVDMANALLSTIKNDKIAKKFSIKAKEQDHKKLGQELLKINRISNALTLKNKGNRKGRLPAGITDNIISYL